jgi:TonB family protein
MRLPSAPLALAAAFLLSPAATGTTPASAQDFSITNPEAPLPPGRRDLMRQLQQWWDLHAYYPRHASSNDEGGTVKLHLLIHADGNIWKLDVVDSSGSASLDAAAQAAFRGGFVRPFPPGMPDTDIDVSLHYILAHRHDQPVPAGYTPVVTRRNFSITNDPVKSPILETMLQRTCTGTVVKQGIRNHPAYGVRYAAEAIFFRKPDGTPWVRFYEGGYSTLSPVTEVGKIVQWSGRKEYLRNGSSSYTQYTVWPDDDNTLSGNLETFFSQEARANQDINRGGTVDFSCATETVPAISWQSLAVTPIDSPVGDPP